VRVRARDHLNHSPHPLIAAKHGLRTQLTSSFMFVDLALGYDDDIDDDGGG
jgi:hypothetical protein